MIGLLIVPALRGAGCETVYAVDIDDDRLRLAERLGATQGINANNTNVVEAVLGLTDGVGAAVPFEAVGATPTVNTAIDSVAKGGVVVLVGNISPRIDLPLQSVVTRELTLAGTCASVGE